MYDFLRGLTKTSSLKTMSFSWISLLGTKRKPYESGTLSSFCTSAFFPSIWWDTGRALDCRPRQCGGGAFVVHYFPFSSFQPKSFIFNKAERNALKTTNLFFSGGVCSATLKSLTDLPNINKVNFLYLWFLPIFVP